MSTTYLRICGYCKGEDMEKVRKDNLSDPRCQEKRRGYARRCPYRKPTQVDEERILRRPDECSLRNSAKKQVYLRYIPCPFACEQSYVKRAAATDPL